MNAHQKAHLATLQRRLKSTQDWLDTLQFEIMGVRQECQLTPDEEYQFQRIIHDLDTTRFHTTYDALSLLREAHHTDERPLE